MECSSGHFPSSDADVSHKIATLTGSAKAPKSAEVEARSWMMQQLSDSKAAGSVNRKDLTPSTSQRFFQVFQVATERRLLSIVAKLEAVDFLKN